MAFQSLSRFHALPLFQTLFAQNTLTQPQFAFKLTETGAELYLGGTNAELYVGVITYLPLLSNHVS
jgi:cathepsin D